MNRHTAPARAGDPLRAPATFGIALAILAAAEAAPAAAQSAAAAAVIQHADDFLAMANAADNASPLCKAYEGKVAAPVPFDALAQRVRAGAGPVVVQVPVRRDYVAYNPKGYVKIAVGAVATGKLHPDTMADVKAQVMLAAHSGDLPDWSDRLLVGLAPTERQTGSYAARNVLGTPMRVAEVERHVRGLALGGGRVFAFARDDADAPAMAFDARGPAAARTVRIALAVQPQAPFVIDGAGPDEAPTAGQPVRYAERATVIVAALRCALALDPANRVLASVDAGSR